MYLDRSSRITTENYFLNKCILIINKHVAKKLSFFVSLSINVYNFSQFHSMTFKYINDTRINQRFHLCHPIRLLPEIMRAKMSADT